MSDVLSGLNGVIMVHADNGAHIGRGVNAAGPGGGDINGYIDTNDVAAIEMYARGGNMPISLQTVDNARGVTAIRTGSRK